MDNQERKQKVAELFEMLKSTDTAENVPQRGMMGVAQEVLDNEHIRQGKYDLAKRILTVLDSIEGAVNRLIEIRAICYETIETYEALETVDDNKADNSDKIILMDPKRVKLNTKPAEYDIKAQMARLMREGQIEPIALTSDNSPDLAEWAYAEAEIIAAIQLGWPTMLFTHDYKDND